MGENATAALDTFAFFATIDARAPGTGSRFGGTSTQSVEGSGSQTSEDASFKSTG